jgi:xanthine dehydrogenase molybdenum-binding subunit
MATRKEYNIIGKRGVPRRYGWAKAAGTAVYTRDVRRPGMLFAKALRNPYAHARIKSMDTSKAAAYPGVRGILRYDDPEVVDSVNPEILMNESWHEGGPIGCIIAADTIQIAEEAAKLVEAEWEELPFYLDMEEALADGAHVLYPEHFPKSNQYTSFLSAFLGGDQLIRGEPDLEAGFAEADVIIEDDIEYKKMYHAGSEPRSYVFEWGADGKELNIWSHSQTPGTEGPMAQGDRLLIPRMLGIPTSNVKVHNTFQGGTFGGKISLEHVFVAVAMLAKKVNAPLIFLQSRSDEQGREDAGLRAHLKIGVKNDGTITAIHLNPAIIEVGDSGVEGEGFIWVVVGGAKPADMIRELLKTYNIETDTKHALTSKVCATSFRCEKNQSGFIHTKVNQLVASKLGIDPVQVALKNGNCATNSLEEVIKAGKTAINWDAKWHKDGTKTLANGKKHGMGFTWSHMWHAGGGNSQFGSFGLALDYDGSATISSATSDVGVSAHTTYIMIAAEELGLTIDKVHYPITNTDLFAAKSPGGSYGCAANAPLVQMVAQQVKKKALNLFAPKFGVTADELDIKNNSVFVKADPSKTKTVAELCASLGCGKFPLVGAIDATIGPGEMTIPYNCFQAHFCEVEVDPETGKIDVTNVVCVNDFGQMIRPESCEGQMYGGYYMGLGPNVCEENIYDTATGCRLNDNLCDYKYALMNDTVFPTILAKEIALDVGVYGNVGSGEPTATITRGLINTAVCNAIGINMNTNPILPGDILKALGKA